MYELVTTWQITIIFYYNLSFSEPTFLLCELQTYCSYIFFVILPSIFYNCYCPGLKMNTRMISLLSAKKECSLNTLLPSLVCNI